jgi:aminoglycoside phosphotransferase (APT) family kinase protein
MAHERVDQTAFSELAERLGAGIRTAEPMGWGDARSTYRLSLADGRRLAARWFAGSDAHARVERIGQLMTSLADADLPVPWSAIIETPVGAWLLTAWVDGETGATWLGDPARARHLAERMGRLASRLRAVDPAIVAPGTRRVAELGDSRTSESTALVHGDFAPVNVVMRADGEVGALLDFEHAGTGPALLDVAWWGWVVRHHHPEAWAAAWPTFLAAAGVEPGHVVEAQLRELVLKTLADRVAAARDRDERRRWLQRLSTARSWTS